MVVLILPFVWHGVVPMLVAQGLIFGTWPAFLGPALGAPPWPGALWFFFYILFIGGGQEELGWRGYALPRLQTRFNAFVSSLIVGAAWGVWHLPMMFIPGSSLYGASIVSYLVLLVLQSIVLTWLYNSTGSTLVCVLYHTWSNFVAVYLMVDLYHPAYGLLALGVQLLIVVLILSVCGPRRLARQRLLGDNRPDP
jgi:membrane protease YdiL (CAAX protease family)